MLFENTSSRKQIVINQALEKLRKLRIPAHCPRCGKKDWHFEITMILNQPMSDFLIPQSTSQMPTLITICTSCGYIAFHNLIALGINL